MESSRMSLFNRSRKESTDASKEFDIETKIDTKTGKKIVIKKTRIGFRMPKKEPAQKERTRGTKNIEEKVDELEDNLHPVENIEIEEAEREIFQDNIPENTKGPEKQWATSPKKKNLLLGDMKAKPVYLEDTGEKLGTVFEMMYDAKNNIIGYKIKDQKTDSVLSFPIDQFEESRDGLIFVQSWYRKAVKTIEELEFKERVSPELTTLISEDSFSNEELYNIFVKHDDQMAHYIEEAISLKELLYQRLKVLEKQRFALKDSLLDLTERRLIKDIDRKEFSEDVMAHRRKVNILDVNISKCRDLLKRLDATSFGKLSKNIIANTGFEGREEFMRPAKNVRENDGVTIEEIEKDYKQKYHDMKERFQQLEEDYDELKSAVEKFIEKGEM
jgi:hypothetical protein